MSQRAGLLKAAGDSAKTPPSGQPSPRHKVRQTAKATGTAPKIETLSFSVSLRELPFGG